jgi:hypothetical protein
MIDGCAARCQRPTPGPSLKLIEIAIGVALVGAMAALVVRHAAPAG